MSTTPPPGKLPYRLLTGKDDREFCERVSQALEEGWHLYGPPRTHFDWWRGENKCAQAVVWPGYGGTPAA
ncbi:DUF1737 domain-containing protein [Alteraurantiacibacter buctensis]|uniref:DUF1737 domain-containing protein n=1 Tax=Alteraurantiacibacter buctensis TaxID=1503981 RepID=A0A844YYQ7_9SPHN|nr:DUF1737 domain-containing protein [Alteraurantiacibacter buctensis]MXO73465.1 DUF1737 domain-containing protein [Alteraurantiacibacter buctensis]